MTTYAYFFLDQADPDPRYGREDSGWVSLSDPEKAQIEQIAEEMEGHHLIEGFTLMPGTPPATQRVWNARELAESLADVAAMGFEQPSNLDDAEWWELGESLARFTPRLLDAVKAEVGDQKPKFPWEQ